MPRQVYIANVSFGANTTLPFNQVANTFQDAAQLAALAYDQNTSVTLANGDTRFAARLNPGVVNSVGGNSRSCTVTVTDPSASPYSTNTYTFTVTSVADNPAKVATYTA